MLLKVFYTHSTRRDPQPAGWVETSSTAAALHDSAGPRILGGEGSL